MKSFVVCVLLLAAAPAIAGTVYGQVVTATGQPRPTNISFVDDSGNIVSVTADAKGHYEVTLQPGHYRVESDAGSVSPASLDVFHEPRTLKLVIAEAK